MGRRGRNRESEDGFEKWGGYMEAKRAKLMDQFKTVTTKQIEKVSNIFQGIAILVNGLTNPSADDLKTLMAQHGGEYHLYQVSTTTHIIASNLPNVKIKQLGSTPIVKPSWITDSISLEKLLDYKRYLLYTNQSTAQPRLDFPVVQKTKEDNPSSSTSPNRLAKTASDPNFLEEFYNNSRLHLIATLGAEFKALVGQLRENSNGIFPGKEKLLALPKKSSYNIIPNTVFMHIDMDCFFVSVGLKKHPELRGKPVAVTHARNAQTSGNRPNQKAIREAEFALYNNAFNGEVKSLRTNKLDETSSMSEIASCSYEARKCGVKNGMFLGTAIKLCPDLKPIPYDFEGYKEVSHTLYETLASYTLDIEAVSCDEMYVDITQVLKESGLTVEEWADHIRNEIISVTGCPCSTGFGANRLQARLATKKAKPNGQFYLQADEVESYMAAIALADLPGVGHATLTKLKNLNVTTCGEVQGISVKILQKELGNKNGETLFEQARGIDRRPLNFNHERKSVSAEVNYGIRFKAVEECHTFLKSLSVEVFNRLSDVGMKARCLTLKLLIRAAEAPVETAKFMGHGFCDSLNKSVTTMYAINDSEAIYKEVRGIYDKLNPSFSDLRGVGIQLSKLEKSGPVNKVLSKFLQQQSTKSEEPKRVKKIEESEQIKSEIKKEKISSRIGSKRGRSKTVSKPINNTLNKFLTKSESPNPKVSVPSSSEIDLDVLNALPEDLRNEIIKDYKLDRITPEIKFESPISENMDRSFIEEAIEDKNSDRKRPFRNLSWDQIKPIIENWTVHELRPLNVDVMMLAEHFKDLAIDRRIELLQRIFNYLHRTFAELNCRWHKAYYKMVNVAQEGMVAKYGGTLMVKRQFRCCQQ